MSVPSLTKVRGALCLDEIASLHRPHCKAESKSAVMNYSHHYISALAGANSSYVQEFIPMCHPGTSTLSW